MLVLSGWPKANTSAHGAGHSENLESRHILIVLLSAKKCNATISINCEHCLEMLKNKSKSYVVRVVFYRILKYAYLLRYVACLGYTKRIILCIDNEWCHKVNRAPSSGYFIIVNSGVGWGVRGGGWGVWGVWVWHSPLVVMGGGVREYTENIQKSQKSHKIQGGAPW